jgi:hypothetical protein
MAKSFNQPVIASKILETEEDQAMTAIIQQAEPTVFDLEGGGATVSYSASSIAGVPQFSYADQNRSVKQSGSEIRTVETEVGLLVTIDVELVPDLHTVSFTLILPHIMLPNGTGAGAVHTIGVLTTNRTSTAPQTIVGQVQSYRILALCGTARQVRF